MSHKIKLKPSRVITVRLVDIVTNAEVVVADIPEFAWAYGNWSCDCNRASAFVPPAERELWLNANMDAPCMGKRRYLVIDTTGRRYTLHELNENYPIDLLVKYVGEGPLKCLARS
jgi:hypothetical protein